MKNTLTISRHWNNPKIRTTITNQEIALQIEFEDFVTALKAEIGEISYKPVDKVDLSKAIIDLIGKVTWKVSQGNFEVLVKEIVGKIMQDKADFDSKLDDAINLVMKKIKEESIKVV